jgi:hypothetical protein
MHLGIGKLRAMPTLRPRPIQPRQLDICIYLKNGDGKGGILNDSQKIWREIRARAWCLTFLAKKGGRDDSTSAIKWLMSMPGDHRSYERGGFNQLLV